MGELEVKEDKYTDEVMDIKELNEKGERRPIVKVDDETIRKHYEHALQQREDLDAEIQWKSTEIALALESIEELDEMIEQYNSYIHLYEAVYLPEVSEKKQSEIDDSLDSDGSIGYEFEMVRQVSHGGYINAKMLRSKDDRHYILKKGSQIANDVTEYLHQGAKDNRKKYGVYVNDKFITQRDIVFETVSQITSFVMGRSGESYTVWKETTTGLTLDVYMPEEWHKKRK